MPGRASASLLVGISVVLGCASAQASAPANLTRALAELASNFANFDALLESGNITGWTDLSDSPCPANGQANSTWSHLVCSDGVLTGFNFSAVNLTGSIQDVQWQNFPNITMFTFSNCNLTGSLPEDLATQLPRISDIDIGYNRLGDHSSGNGLTGKLPPGWGSFKQLESLFIAGNSFTGTVPGEWGAWPKLKKWSMDNNQLSGPLNGSWATQMPLMEDGLFAFGNSFTGSLPGEWGAWPRITNIQLHYCQLSGSLPVGIGNLSNLAIMTLNNNRFSGPLPASWGTSPIATTSAFQQGYISLNGNYLTGSIPASWAGTASRPREVNLQDNPGLCGSAPYFTAGGDTDRLPVCSSPPSPPSHPPPPTPAIIVPGPPVQISSSSLAGGGIAGIIVGVVVGVALTLAAFLVWRRFSQRRHSDAWDKSYKSKGLMLSNSSTATGSSFTSSSNSEDPLGWFQAAKNRGYFPPMSNGGEPGQSGIIEFDWRVDPSRVDICALPDGKPWALGSGGYGTVYKARLDGLVDVAVKFIKPTPRRSGREQAERFNTEISILRACRDRNIVNFVGAFIYEEYAYMVQEFMSRGDLFTALSDSSLRHDLSWRKRQAPPLLSCFAVKKGYMSTCRGQYIALDVAKGLHYLHSNSVVHLDIKSPNILLDSHWNAKIADTGLARTLFSKTHLSKTMPGGTYAWQAPETLLGLPSSYSADIWSFAVVMLELITGTRQVRGQYAAARADQCSHDIVALVEDCMCPEPSGRPNARAVVLRIEASFQ